MADQRTDFIPLAPVTLVRPNGARRAFKPFASTAAARGAALVSAAAAAVAYDSIELGPGEFNIGDNSILVPENGSLIGKGIGVTKITSSLREDAAMVCPSDNSTTAHLTIQGTSTTLFQFPFGSKGADTGEPDNPALQDEFTGAVISNCELIGDTDALYINHATACSLRATDCIFTSLFDSVRVFHQIDDTNPAHSVDLINCKITATGPSVVSSGGATRAVYCGSASLSSTNAVTRLHSCQVSASNAGATVASAVFAIGGAKIELHGGCTTSTSGGSSNYDINSESSGSEVRVAAGVKYDASKLRTASSGTIPYLAAYGTTPTTAGLTLLGGASATAQRTSLGASNGTWLAANQQCTTFLALSGGAVSGSFSSMGAGSSALINFATTDPQITITTAGTYLIIARVVIISPGLSAASGGSCAMTLRRTNNTAANLTGAASTISFGDDGGLTVSTAVTITAIYTTANTDDVIELWGNDIASIGLTASNPQITAIQLGTGSI